MKKNVGSADKVIRILIVLAIGILIYFGVFNGAVDIVLLGVAAVFLLTAITGFCPLYSLFGISSCPFKTPKKQ